MAQDGDKEDKLEFTAEGETQGYINSDQARVSALRTAMEAPGDLLDIPINATSSW